MKKVFGIIIPLLITLVTIGALLYAYSADRKGFGCNLENEPGVQVGKRDHQVWIDEIERCQDPKP